MIPKQERGVTPRFPGGWTELRSYHRTGGRSYYGRKKQFNLFYKYFTKSILLQYFEFGLRVDSIVLTI